MTRGRIDQSTRRRRAPAAVAVSLAIVLAASATTGASPPADGADHDTEPVPSETAVAIARAHVLADEAVVTPPSNAPVVGLPRPSTSGAMPGPGAPAADDADEDFVVSSVVTSDHNGLTHVYLQQQLGGLDVLGAIANVAVDPEGEVVAEATRRVEPGSFGALAPPEPRLTALDAALEAIAAVGHRPSEPLVVLERARGVDRSQTLSSGGVARESIPARLVVAPVGARGVSRLAWEVIIDEADGDHWWIVAIDAEDGTELGRSDLVTHDSFVDDGSSYAVLPALLESPNHGPFATVAEPADPVASPFGWHDTDGVAGADTDTTVGNNVDAGTDLDGDDVIDPGSRTSGGAGLDFLDVFDPGGTVSDNRAAAVTNLFYWNNALHDALYHYGFDEAAGNFQTVNHGPSGLGGDAVEVHAQDSYLPVAGAVRDNANFATPPDGSPPRLQMYVFCGKTGSSCSRPEVDSSFDAGVIAHEYAHGLSNRLTGGPAASSCLENDEQMGEGWSDVVALLLTMQGGAAADRTRGIGTYVLGQATTGVGIRSARYATGGPPPGGTNPWTYADIASTGSSPHALGQVWAQMLWEMAWALIDVHGFDPDLVHGDGGNNLALQLIVDGLKLQPCSPGFVDARDAILQADAIDHDGANACTIWNSFAQRGLGVGADQGSSGDRRDGVASFDAPPRCSLVSLAAPDDTEPGDQVAYELFVRNDEPTPLTSVTVSTPVPASTTYVDSSATCGGDLVAGEVVMAIPDVPAGGVASCRFDVVVDDDAGEASVIDEFVDLARWDRPSGVGVNTWDLVDPGIYSIFDDGDGVAAATPASASLQHLTLGAPVRVGNGDELRIVHAFGLEGSGSVARDGGVVEVSADAGATWIDAAPYFTRGGYNATIAPTDNPLTGRPAFSGSGLVASAVDLSAFEGDDLLVRFTLGSNGSVGSGPSDAWLLLDVVIGSPDVVSATSTMTAEPSVAATASARTEIVGAPFAAPDPPAPPDPPPDPPPSEPSDVINPLLPTRLVDTRLDAADGALVAGAELVVAAAGHGGVAPDARAALVNLTAIRPADTGYLTVHPCLDDAPLTAGLNVTAGVTLGNEIVAELDAQGNFCVVSSTGTHLAVDVVGEVGATSPYVALDPTRLLDTRLDGLVDAGSELVLRVPESSGVPSGAERVVVNVTAINPSADGFVTVHPCLDEPPLASSLNHIAGVTRGNEIVAELDAAGAMCLHPSAATHLAVDLVGYVPAGTSLSTVAPARLADSRPGGTTIDAAFAAQGVHDAGETRTIRIAGRAGVAPDAAAAVLNITAVSPSADGFVTVHDCGERPLAAALNFSRGVTGGNELVAALSGDGDLCVYTSDPTHLTIDVTGFAT